MLLVQQQGEIILHGSPDADARGIRINDVYPGMIRTAMTDQMEAAGQGEALKTMLEQNVPMKREGKPEEIPDAVLFLCSDKTGYITGQLISVDGGFVMREVDSHLDRRSFLQSSLSPCTTLQPGMDVGCRGMREACADEAFGALRGVPGEGPRLNPLLDSFQLFPYTLKTYAFHL